MDLMRKKFYSMLTGGIISSVVVSLMLVSDAVVAGILFGDKAVAGMSLVIPFYSFAASLATLLSVGAPILYSEAIGRFEQDRATRIFQTGLTAALGCGIILFLICLIFGDYYLSSFHTAPEILESAKTYLFWIGIDIIFLPVSLYLPGMLLVDGDEMLSTISDVAGSVFNILLSVILGKMIGVAGIGIGSLIGSVISLFICLIHFVKKRNSLKPGFCFSGRMIRTISYYGIVDAASSLFLAVFATLMNLYLTVHFGSNMLILSSVIIFVIEMQFLLDGVGEAMTPSMNIYMTIGCRDGVIKIWREAKRAAIAIGLVCTLGLAAFAPLIPGVLGISDPDIAHTATAGVRILSISMPAVALLYLLTSYNVMTKRIISGVVITALYELILSFLLAMLLGNHMGIYGVFAGVSIAPVVTWFAVKWYVEWKEGKASWPLRLHGKNSRSFLFDFVVKPDDILDMQSIIEGKLRSAGISPAAISRFIFLFEEVYMLVYDKNKPKAVSGECILILQDQSIQFIEMDDGIVFEMVNEVEKSKSLREYVLSQTIIYWSESSEYLKAISFNRNRFKINVSG